MSKLLAIVFYPDVWEGDCWFCNAPLRVLPGPAIITWDELQTVCPDCARRHDPYLWSVLQAWNAAQQERFERDFKPRSPITQQEDNDDLDNRFDADFWREALR